MKKQIIIALALFTLLTTINFQQETSYSKFNLKKIDVENNYLVEDKDIKRLLAPIYNQNLLFLSLQEIEIALLQNSFVESFNIKKKYPNTLKIKIYEKKPVAILLNKETKFYLSEKIDLIKFKNIPNFKNLPYVIGDQQNFKIFYNDLKKINFPFNQIKKYTLFKSNRWDIETINKITIKLPTKNYIEKLKNYLMVKDKTDFKNYKVFDYRIENQLILK
tara:strand:- start:280 stop:936 length:657 start_codon:yes stop_codon:yes gene_type:complete